MFRKDLIELLCDNPMSVTQIARLVGETPSDVAADLEHLFLSLKHTEYAVAISPAQCRKCGFEFSESKLRKPSKCPACHGTWLTEPQVRLERRSRANGKPEPVPRSYSSGTKERTRNGLHDTSRSVNG